MTGRGLGWCGSGTGRGSRTGGGRGLGLGWGGGRGFGGGRGWGAGRGAGWGRRNQLGGAWAPAWPGAVEQAPGEAGNLDALMEQAANIERAIGRLAARVADLEKGEPAPEAKEHSLEREEEQS